MRILIALYGSAHDDTALSMGSQLAQRAGEPPTVLTLFSQRHEGPLPPANNRTLTGAPISLGQEGMALRTRTWIGNPAEAIVAEAREGGYGLIVLGYEQNHGVLTRLRRGPVPILVMRQTSYPRPVLVAKGSSRPIRRILLCDSGSSSPSTGLGIGESRTSCVRRFVTQLADLFAGDEITVLHVMSQISAGPGVRGRQLRATLEELIEERAPEGELLVQDLQDLDHVHIHPRVEIRHGLVVEEVLAEARDGDYDLIVIGAHANQGWQSLLLDDLAAKIMAGLDRSVLVVR